MKNLKLQFTCHIDQIYKKNYLALLGRLKSCLSSEQLCQVYQAFIQPRFDYIITIWGCCFTSDVNKLQRLQTVVQDLF